MHFKFEILIHWFNRCLDEEECEGVTVEGCDHPLPIKSWNTTSSFDCEKQCKLDTDCLFFKFTEGNGVCDLFESEYRANCYDVSGPLVSNYNVEIIWTIQRLVEYFCIPVVSIVV